MNPVPGSARALLRHTVALAYLRRLAGGPIRGENYAKATIVAGGIGLSYDTPRVEFDYESVDGANCQIITRLLPESATAR